MTIFKLCIIPEGMTLKDGLFVPAFKGTAVHAALVGRVLLMRSDIDALERAIILLAVVILAVFDAAMDTVIHVIFVKHHFTSLLTVGRQLSSDKNSIRKFTVVMHQNAVYQ